MVSVMTAGRTGQQAIQEALEEKPQPTSIADALCQNNRPAAPPPLLLVGLPFAGAWHKKPAKPEQVAEREKIAAAVRGALAGTGVAGGAIEEAVAGALAAVRASRYVDDWLELFPKNKQDFARILVNALDRCDAHDPAQLKQLHAHVLAELGNPENLDNVVFAYKGQSARDMVGHYCRANRIPDAWVWKGGLWPADAADKTVVFLEKYVGTGFDSLQRLSEEVIDRGLPFKKVVWACIRANPQARQTYTAAHENDMATLHKDMEHFIGVRPVADANVKLFTQAAIHKVPFTVVPAAWEVPLLDHVEQTHGAEVCSEFAEFLKDYSHGSIRFDEIGTRTVFLDNVPNQLPGILWNSTHPDECKALRHLEGVGMVPLFNASYDRSHRKTLQGMPTPRLVFDTAFYDATKYAYCGTAAQPHPGDRKRS